MRQLRELTAANREQPDPATERRLLRLRHRAFGYLSLDPGADTIAPGAPVEHEGGELPLLESDQLSPERARAAILEAGSVQIKHLLEVKRIEDLKLGIDRAFEASRAYGELVDRGEEAAWTERDDAAWYCPFNPLPGYTLGGGRNWNRNDSAIWAADSPRVMFELIEIFERAGIADLVNTYLGERAAISMNKTVLRRVSPRRGGADWHQDGAFLGEGIRSINVWLSLSDCGITAPGMDVVARRLDGIVPTGGEGANFDWSVSPADAERAAGDAGIVRPHFEPGDALLFDHLMLHRTASEETMTEQRYAVETWFFAPSAYPDGQVPLVL